MKKRILMCSLVAALAPAGMLLATSSTALAQTAPAAEPQGNAPAHVTATICTGSPQVLAVQGDLSAFCG